MSRLRPVLAAIAIAAAALALDAAPAAALSKHVFSTSFAGSGPTALSDPTAVAVDSQSGDVYVANRSTDQQQSILVHANGGSFTLAFEGQRTHPIAYGASPGKVQEALEELPAIGRVAESVRASGGATEYLVEFTGNLTGQEQPLLVAEGSQLSGTGASIEVSLARAAAAASEVEKLDSEGHFIWIAGREVDKSTGADLCSAASGDECRPGAIGASPGAFTDPRYLALDQSGGPSNGDLYVADHIPGAASDVQKLDPEGHLVASWRQGGLLDENPQGFSFKGLDGIAVDPAGNLFVHTLAKESNIKSTPFNRYLELGPDGAFLAGFKPEDLQPAPTFGTGLLADGADHLYFASLFSEGHDAVGALDPFAPTAGNFNAYEEPGRALGTPILGLGETAGIGLQAASRDLYLTLRGGAVQHYLGSCTTIELLCLPFESFGAGHLTEPAGVAVNEATGAVYVADPGAQRVAVFTATPYLPDVSASAQPHTAAAESLAGRLDPAAAGPVGACRFQYVAPSESPGNERQSVSLTGASGGSFTLTATTATLTANLTSGSNQLTSSQRLIPHASRSEGGSGGEPELFKGDAIAGPGIPPGTSVAGDVPPGVRPLLSAAASATSAGATLTATETTAPIAAGAGGAEVGAALEALPGIAAGEVAASGPPGGPYTIEFKGRFANLDLPQIGAEGSELTPSGATVSVATVADGGAWANAASVPCTEGQSFSSPATVHAEATGLAYGSAYHFRLLAENANGAAASYDQTFETLPQEPLLGTESLSAVNSDGALIHDQITPGGGDAVYHTDYHVEYATQAQFEAGEWAEATSTPSADAGSARSAQAVTVRLFGLTPNTTYHYRVFAHNASGTATGQGRTFTTLPAAITTNDPCPNAHVRQQTGAAGLLDCRAYELVSAADAGGYDVESNLIAGQAPFAGYPEADGRVLYGVHGGGIPGAGDPTNRGLDPYLARRGESGWSTAYVGIPANDPFATAPFASPLLGADSGLRTFAFGGPGLCAPCFGPGGVEAGIPLRLPSGELVQGMAGPGEEPEAKPDGLIAKPLSAEGSHLIFGSSTEFAAGGNHSTGDVSIYDRNLASGETHVVSNTPSTEDFPEPLPCLQGNGSCHAPGDANGLAELDVSADGSHILLGQKVSEDAAHNVYYHLYIDVNDSVSSIDLTPGVIAKHGGPGFSAGVLFDGMSADGSKVYFTTTDKLLAEDTDASVDLYLAEVGEGSATLQLISSGEGGASNSNACDPVANSNGPHWNALGAEESCGAVAIGGGGGVAAASGAIYFLSPEKLSEPGASCGIPCSGEEPVPNQPNLYLAAPGSPPRFIATLEPSNPLVLDAVKAAAARRTADFQVAPSGEFAAFPSSLELLPETETAERTEIYRYDAGAAQLACASCTPSGAPSEGDASLAQNGLSLTADGRVFFDSTDQLAAADTDGRRDVYQYEPPGTGNCTSSSPSFASRAGACLALISAGTSTFDSGLLSATANGTDAYFFTRDSLAPQDRNGPTMKVYDARAQGGFPFTPPPTQCQASDECHGPGSPPRGPVEVGSLAGTEGNLPPAKHCKKGFVKKHGRRCVRKPHHHKRASHKHGGHR